jgi:hypothetical protein
MYPEHLPLSDDLRDAHERALATIAAPGPSWTGEERVSMVLEARAAVNCSLCRERQAALSPRAVSGVHDGPGLLDPQVVDAIHRIRTDPGRLTKSLFDAVTAVISPAAWVEMVSVVNTSVIVDTLHRSLGQPLPDLPAPEAGPPTDDPPGDTVNEGAWVPIMAAPRHMSDTGLPAVPNIFRAMGLVPAAVDLFFQTFRPHYALKDIRLSISQAQAEFVASRVSAMNECFY